MHFSRNFSDNIVSEKINISRNKVIKTPKSDIIYGNSNTPPPIIVFAMLHEHPTIPIPVKITDYYVIFLSRFRLLKSEVFLRILKILVLVFFLECTVFVRSSPSFKCA